MCCPAGFSCALCRWTDNQIGIGEVIVPQLTKRGVPPPPALDGDGTKAMSDGRLFRIITAGQGNMAPHAVQVGRDDRWRVVRFIRSLQGVSK